ncbi:Hypothetical protein PHPALM_6358 [Phytophthora palmivora]|uniref:Uncharacterized protein n=1 Tax=Phytophthora palmivora TaxID=4796 RepID=A0A2P4YF27_9STRA|nr:Hypothetical protein PHPALM_6358 [Phytophthora palmivora]
MIYSSQAIKAPPKGRTSIKGVRQKLSECPWDGVSNGKKTSVTKSYQDLGMDATLKKLKEDCLSGR